MIDFETLARARHAPADCGLRLLLDPYLCFGPGSESHGRTLYGISQRCATLGLELCVEGSSWQDAANDPDVQRRGVDLSRFEPLSRLPDLPLPSERDLEARFIPARSEIDETDLKLLGALHSRKVELLIAHDTRLHRLAHGAGLGARILTPADALAWLDALAGHEPAVTVTETDPRSAEQDPAVASLLAEECEPFDPYLRARLASARGRVLLARHGESLAALGVLGEGTDDALALVALAANDITRGQRALEPIVAAALALARRKGVALEALVPPHQDHALHLLEQLGFVRGASDDHGREHLRLEATPAVPAPAAGAHAWLWPLTAAQHDELVPELAGPAQSGLFAAAEATTSLAGPLRRLWLHNASEPEPVAGDLLLLQRPRLDAAHPAALTSALRVSEVRKVVTLAELLAFTAGRRAGTLASMRERLAGGPVTILELEWLGRLAQPLTLPTLVARAAVKRLPSVARRLDAEPYGRIALLLQLG